MTDTELRLLVEGSCGECILLPDGFADAFLGIGWHKGEASAVYSRPICIEILMRQGMDMEAAEEYFQYNVEGAMFEEGTPTYMETLEGMTNGFDPVTEGAIASLRALEWQSLAEKMADKLRDDPDAQPMLNEYQKLCGEE